MFEGPGSQGGHGLFKNFTVALKYKGRLTVDEEEVVCRS